MNSIMSQRGNSKVVSIVLVVVVLLIVGAVMYMQGGDDDHADTPADTADAPSGELVITDVVEGTGDVVESGDPVMVHYTGVLLDGTVFDTSYTRGTPFIFVVGEGQVIQGWDMGILGMRVGGTRQLTVPAHLGYGEAGAGESIPPNSDLLFEIELLGIENKQGIEADEELLELMAQPDAMPKEMTEAMSEEEASALINSESRVFTQRATLKDVTMSEEIHGVNTFGAASGVAFAGLDNGQYALLAQFTFVPEAPEGFFYEGWVVRRDPLSIVSTGPTIEREGIMVNVFSSQVDLSDHGLYVLTLEPDDNDPAPADHILDGSFISLQ